MTVCLASDGFPPKAGGVVSFNWHLTQLLLAAGHAVVQINIDREQDAEDRILYDGLFSQVWLGATYQRHKQQWSPLFRPGGMEAPGWIAAGLAMRRWLLSNAKPFQIDIVEASDFGGYGAFLSDPQLPPLALTGHAGILQLSRHNHYPQKEESYDLLRRLEEIAYQNTAALIAHSGLNQLDLQTLTKAPVYQALMPWTMPEIPFGSTHNKRGEILAVGALQPVKGVEVLVNAAILLRQRGLNVSITWVGADTFHSPEINSLANYLAQKYPGVWGEVINWVDGEPHNAVIERMQGAEMVVMPSLFETFGYTLLEAAACRKPIVTTDAVGAAQHFEHRKSALIVPANDAQELANAIGELLENRTLAESLGEEAYHRLKQQFPASNIVAERLAAYKQIIANAPKQPTGFQAAIEEIKPYQTSWRKLYFAFRARVKKIVKRKN